MVHLDLTLTEAETLLETLENYLSELRAEISHTDSADFRETLKERKEVLQGVAERLVQKEPATHG